jgi:hypothetical protein
LPAPLGPMIAVTFPAAIDRFRFLNIDRLPREK